MGDFIPDFLICPFCGSAHLGGRCPSDRDSAERYIKYWNDVIKGQFRKIADEQRADLAKKINYWRVNLPWGPDVHRRANADPLMLPHLNAAAKAGARLDGMFDGFGHNGGPALDAEDELTPAQTALALSMPMLEFVDAEANKYGHYNRGIISDLVAAAVLVSRSCDG